MLPADSRHDGFGLDESRRGNYRAVNYLGMHTCEEEINMPYQLPALTYPFNALEPHIDARTMEIHHDKHHAAYVTNVNKAIENTEWDNRPIEELLRGIDKVPENIRTAVRNHGGGHANHSMFWITIGPGKGGQPGGKLGEAIKSQLGGFDAFKQAFSAAAAGRFGSGWAWLSVDKNKKLVVESTANQDSPLMHGNVPVLGIDVWEHAYYLLYQNRRPDYIASFYNVIDWDAVSRLYETALK
jgi:Fe-Mn family superoxide dismutase